MNAVSEIINEVKGRGVVFVVDGDRLGVRGQLPADILSKARRHFRDGRSGSLRTSIGL